MTVNAVDTKNILLIDDDKLILGSLSKVFIRFGWNVQVLMGHSDVRVSQRYVEISGKSRKEAVARLKSLPTVTKTLH